MEEKEEETQETRKHRRAGNSTPVQATEDSLGREGEAYIRAEEMEMIVSE